MKRGRLISFEGPEGVGKSTQIELLSSYLKKKGHSVYLTREPGGTPLGEKLRKLFKTEEMDPVTELLIVEASRAEHVRKVLKPRLEAGEIILCDRYQESSLVYQSHARGIPESIVRRLNRIATDSLQAHLILYFDMSIDRAMKRLKKRAGSHDRFDEESLKFHKKILQGYRKLYRQQKRPPLRKIRAELSPEKVHESIVKHVEAALA